MAEIISDEVFVSSGTTRTGLYVVQGGILKILDDGFAKDVGLVDGGRAEVSEDGTLYLCTVSSGGMVTLFDGGFAQDVTVENGGLYLLSGGTAHKSVVSSGGTQIVRPVADADLTVASAIVMNGGVLHVSDGGYLFSPVVSSGGMMHVWGGGLVTRAAVTGTVAVNPNAFAETVQVLSGGMLSVLPDAFAFVLEIGSGGRLEVASDGFVSSAVVSDGFAVISAGGSAFNTRIDGGGTLLLESSGETEDNAFASGITVNSGGSMLLCDGAAAIGIVENGGYVEVAEDADAVFARNTFSGLVLSDASATVHSGTTAQNVTADAGGKLKVYSGGVANGIIENGGYVEVADGATVSFTANTITSLTLASGRSATIHSGTVAAGIEARSGGTLDVFDGGRITGKQTLEDGAAVSMYAGAVLDFDLGGTAAGADALVNDLSLIRGTPLYTLTVDGAEAEGAYALADGAETFSGTLSVLNGAGELFGDLTPGETLEIGGTAYSLDLNGSVLTLTVGMPEVVPTNLVGSQDRLSWEAPGAEQFVVECSADDFAHALPIDVSGPALDLFELPAGTYLWRVRLEESDLWAVGEEFVSDTGSDTPEVVRSDANGSDDLFFASTNGTWEKSYYAQHVGSIDDWTGTNEIVSANGKGRIRNLFFGSADPNVLCLTDGDNGDAIFVDDVYTELPEEIETNTARLYKIREIRAGAGDDIVDMTSRQFVYTGDGLTIRGGDGNDIIWANKGGNSLFGDAGNDRIVGASGNDIIAGGIGNDRMHGGGGNDVFTFCDNWGSDNVEQLATGSVTLWFAESESQITASEFDGSSVFTNADGTASVTVRGFKLADITVKYGDDGSGEYDVLASAGAFSDATSGRIFEESGKGILASL